MARIRTERTAERLRVVVAGRLTAADMRRLEHACAEALTTRRPRLEIDLRGVTHTDGTAVVLIQCLVERGAAIMPPPDATS